MSFLQNKTYTNTIVLLIVTIFFGIQLTFLNADTPTFLSDSQGPYTDEGYKTLDARNLVLFGSTHWTIYEEYPGWIKRSPVTVIYNYVMFKIFGVSLSAARFGSLLFAIGSLLLFYLILDELYDKKHALLGLFLLAINKMFFFYSRLAMFEVSMNFFILLGIYCAIRWKENRVFIVLAIVSSIAAYYCKPLAVFFYATPVLYYFIVIHKDGEILKLILRPKILLSTSLLVLGCFLILEYISIVLPGLYYFHIWSERTLQSPSLILLSILTHHFMTKNPFLFSLSILYSGSLIFAIRDYSSFKKEDVFFVIWLFSGMFVFLLFAYHPARYFYFLVFPVIVLSVRGILSLPFILNALLEKKDRLIKGAIFVLSFYYLIIHSTILSINPVSVGSRWINSAILPFAISSSILTLILIVFYGLLIKKKTLFNISSVVVDWKLREIIIVLMAVVQLIPTATWALQPRYDLINISERVKTLDENAKIVGMWAPTLLINTKNRVIIGYHRKYEKLEKIRPDFLIAKTSEPNMDIYNFYNLRYPGVLSPEPVMVLNYSGRTFSVYKMDFNNYEYNKSDK